MHTYVLARPGDAPLRFTGEVIAESEGRMRDGSGRHRWHDIRLYRTRGDGFVLEIEYHTRWQGEEGHRHVEPLSDASAVVEALRSYDPLAYVRGYPPGEAHREKQRRLEFDLRAYYEAQVGEMLAEHASLFAEEFA